MSRSSQDIDRVVGARVAARRMALGLSQTALARALGVSFQQLQKYETGVNRISASRLHRIAMATGASVADFFPDGGSESEGGDGLERLRMLTDTAEGRAVAQAFPRILDQGTRQAVARVVEALAAPG